MNNQFGTIRIKSVSNANIGNNETVKSYIIFNRLAAEHLAYENEN